MIYKSGVISTDVVFNYIMTCARENTHTHSIIMTLKWIATFESYDLPKILILLQLPPGDQRGHKKAIRGYGLQMEQWHFLDGTSCQGRGVIIDEKNYAIIYKMKV